MLGAIVAAVAATLAAAPAPGNSESPTRSPDPMTCPTRVDATLVGPRAAAVELVFYVDPAEGDNLRTWLALRQLIADFEGQVRVRVLTVRSSQLDAHHRDHVRRWFLAATLLGRTEVALRVLARDGQERLQTRITRAAQRDELAREMKLDPATLLTTMRDPCSRRMLAANNAAFRRELARAAGRLSRPPLFAVGEQLAVEKLSAVPEAIANEHRRLHAPRTNLRSPARPQRRGLSPRVMQPPGDAGLLVGGVGVPHRLVLFVNPDPRPRLRLLGPVIAFVQRNPGRLAIQIIARGSNATAKLLRQRFCSARRLGIELEYLRVLAELPTGKHPDPHTAAEMIERRLDSAPGLESCPQDEAVLQRNPDDDEDDEIAGLPDGIWLDGGVVNSTSDLELIELRLREIEASADPLDPVFSLLPENED